MERRGVARLLGESAAIRQVRERLLLVARRPAPALLIGESGTGKELAARALHEESARRDGPFVVVDCAAVPEQLIESELFGHEAGAFTGATTARAGKFEQSHGGTLLLDEITALPVHLQGKLLRALDSGVIQRLGGAEPQQVDFWLLSASNRDPATMVAPETFRADLYYRLRVIEVRLPALSERREDVPLLARHFLALTVTEQGLPSRSFTPAALAHLARRPWHGNVRELANRIVETAILAEGTEIDIADLPPDLQEWTEEAVALAAETSMTLAELEASYIAHVLRRTGGRIGEAARLLGIHRKTLLEKRKRYGLR